MMPMMNGSHLNTDSDENYCEIIMARQFKADKGHDTLRDYNSILIGSTVAVQQEERDHGLMAQLLTKEITKIISNHTNYAW